MAEHKQSSPLIPDLFTTIHNRKSVRNFTGEPVSKEQLDMILKAAMAAPSAVNMQPWAFVVITDKKTMDSLADILPFAKMLYKAGAAICVCMIPEKAYEKRVEFAIMDCSAASQNILLSAEALGLGAVWTAAEPWEELADNVRKILGIPGNILPLNIIPIGHPTGEDLKKNKFKAENIHWGNW
jgi:nitroreductase